MYSLYVDYLYTDQEANEDGEVRGRDVVDRVHLDNVPQEEAVEQDVSDEVRPDVDGLVVETQQALQAGEEPQSVLSVSSPDVGVRPPVEKGELWLG